jgi:hypothetical protein
MLPVQNAVAGAAGSPYRAIVTTNKGVGNFVINDTNFPGIGRYLPCYLLVLGATPANISVSHSINNGSAWLAGPGSGSIVYADAPGVTGSSSGVSTTSTVRVNVATGATDVHLLPIGAS